MTSGVLTFETKLVGLLSALFFLYKKEGRDVDDIVSTILDKLERDGFVAVEKDESSGEKELITISEVVAKSIKEANK